MAEVHDCFTITEILNYEDLGLAAPGEGHKLASAGVTRWLTASFTSAPLPSISTVRCSIARRGSRRARLVTEESGRHNR